MDQGLTTNWEGSMATQQYACTWVAQLRPHHQLASTCILPRGVVTIICAPKCAYTLARILRRVKELP